MSISDRLDEIQDRYEEWHQDRGRHTPAPDTTLWRLADYPDESMDHCIVRNDVPDMLAALRAVLDMCDRTDASIEPRGDFETGQASVTTTVRAVIAAALMAHATEQAARVTHRYRTDWLPIDPNEDHHANQ